MIINITIVIIIYTILYTCILYWTLSCHPIWQNNLPRTADDFLRATPHSITRCWVFLTGATKHHPN